MTKKRSSDAEGVQTNESESLRKKVKIVDVSNQVSDGENQGAQNETKIEHVTEEALKKDLKMKIGPGVKPKRYVKKKKNDSEISKSVSKDGAIASTGGVGETVQGSQRLSVSEENDNTSTTTDPDRQFSVCKEVECSQVPKLSELEMKKAGESTVTHSDCLLSVDKEVEDLLTEMFSVTQDKDSVIVSTDSDCLRKDGMEIDDSQTAVNLVPQKTCEPRNKGECDIAMKIDDSSNNKLFVKCFEVPHEKEDSLGLLMMDLEDTPIELSEQGNKIVLQVEGLDDYITISSQSNTEPKNENENGKIADNVVNGGIKILDNQSTENTVTVDNKKVACNQDEITFQSKDSPLLRETTSENLGEDVKKKNDKVTTQATLPITNHNTVHIEDEISCEMCEQKIKMTLEGTDIFHSNLILRNEDGTNVSIENINTIYSVRCKNKHLCYIDFEMIGKMKMVPPQSSSKYNFVHIEDEIPCKKCCQKIKMKLEGIDLLHSNMVLLDEDDNNVTIENIKTTYSVHCKNKHLCNFDFALMEREELQFEEKIDCWQKLGMFVWNVWKKMELMVTRVLFE